MKRLFALTPEAKSDLKEILLDIAEDSPATAERLRTEFYEGLQAAIGAADLSQQRRKSPVTWLLQGAVPPFCAYGASFRVWRFLVTLQRSD